MDSSAQPLTPDVEAMLALHGGPITVPGRSSNYVIMRPDVYTAMLGLADDEEAETLASVRRGVADLNAGRVQELDDAFDELDQRDGD